MHTRPPHVFKAYALCVCTTHTYTLNTALTATLQSAQEAKRKTDEFLFYSNLLDVTYAPQFETVEETT